MEESNKMQNFIKNSTVLFLTFFIVLLFSGCGTEQ